MGGYGGRGGGEKNSISIARPNWPPTARCFAAPTRRSSCGFRPDTAQRRPSELLSGTPMSAPAQPAGPKHIPKILVVEDTKLAAECLCMVLKELGCATDHAEDGAEALEHLMMDSEMYSLVLMDLRMPVMDGFDATLAIRKMGIDLPVIAVTADETFDTRRR